MHLSLTIHFSSLIQSFFILSPIKCDLVKAFTINPLFSLLYYIHFTVRLLHKLTFRRTCLSIFSIFSSFTEYPEYPPSYTEMAAIISTSVEIPLKDLDEYEVIKLLGENNANLDRYVIAPRRVPSEEDRISSI